MNNEASKDYTESYRQLIKQQQTLLLSTVNKQAEPEASYAPYVRDAGGVFYIYVSELASHTQNMLQKQTASILIIRLKLELVNLYGGFSELTLNILQCGEIL